MKEFIENLTSETNSELMVLLGVGIIFFVLILSIILIISYVKALKKAKLSVSNILWGFLPVIGNIILAIKLDPVKKFNKSTGYLIGLILLPIIFVPMLAFSDDEYIDSKANETPNNTFDATAVINSNQTESSETSITVPESNINIETTENTINEINNVEEKVEIPNESISNEPIVNIPTEPVNDDKEIEISTENNLNIPEIESETNSVEENNMSDETTIETENVNSIGTNEIASPVIETESSNVEVPNAFNSKPIVSSTTVDDLSKPETLESPLNVEPTVIEEVPVMEQEIEPQIITEIPNIVEEQKKVCKNCGNELPNIVSICPNCGTDNE